MAKIWLGLTAKDFCAEQRVQRLEFTFKWTVAISWQEGGVSWFLLCFNLCPCSSAAPGYSLPLWLWRSRVLWWVHHRPDLEGRSLLCLTCSDSTHMCSRAALNLYQFNIGITENSCWLPKLVILTDLFKLKCEPVLDPGYHFTSELL